MGSFRRIETYLIALHDMLYYAPRVFSLSSSASLSSGNDETDETGSSTADGLFPTQTLLQEDIEREE